MSKNVHLVFGTDEYLVSGKAKALADRLVPEEERTFGLEIVDGAVATVEEAVNAVDSCLQALLTRGFLQNRKVVWLHNASFLGDSVVGKSDTVREKLSALTNLLRAGLAEGTILLVSAGKVDKRTAFFRACKEVAELDEFTPPDRGHRAEKATADHLRAFLKKRGLSMSRGVATAFMERIGSDTRQMATEIEKLDVYLGERREVTADDVRALTPTTREAIGFDLSDAVGNRDLPRSLALVRRLLFQKASPVMLIAILERLFRELLVIREAMDRGWLRRNDRGKTVTWSGLPPEVEAAYAEEMERDPRSLHPFRTWILAGQAARYSQKRLQACLHAAVEAHTRLVSGGSAELILETFLVRALSRA